MKKYLAMICAAMLCVCCLALAACGGGSGSAASASGSASGSAAASSSAATADDAIGTWKLAAIETQGITVAGDFSMFLGSNESISLTIEKDGKASMSMGSDSADLTWEANGSDITLKKTESSSSSSASASSSSSNSNPFFDNGSSSSSDEFKATLKDDALFINIEQDGQKMSMIFTADGTYADAKIIDPKKADKITSESDLVGEWKLSGMDMMGISMYGDPSDLASMMGSTGSTSDLTVKFEAGGKGKIMGEDCTYKVDSSGATATISGQSLPITKLGDDLLVDFTSLYGMEFAFAFSK